MHVVYISGTSSGIGKGLAEHFLATDPTCQVIGFARRSTWEHERYNHVTVDLAELSDLEKISFSIPKGCTHISLVNNAGVIGDIKRIGKASDADIMQLAQLNVGSLMVMTNRFLKAINNTDVPCTILNISSGAAKYAIDAWAPYCASKAAVDHFSVTVQHEQEITGGNARLFSVAPGIVDTEMQGVIRSSNDADFSRHADFVAMKNNGELDSPTEVAKKLYRLLTNPAEIDSVLVDVREMN
jgi:benzil reductase ((S)-benzoin forming)